MNTEHLMEIEREYSTGEREYPVTKKRKESEPWADTLEEANS